MNKRQKVKKSKKDIFKLIHDLSVYSDENRRLKNEIKRLKDERKSLMLERSRLTDGTLTSCWLDRTVMTCDGTIVQYPSWDVGMRLRILPSEIVSNPDFVYWQCESIMYNFLETIHKDWQDRKNTFSVVSVPMMSERTKLMFPFSEGKQQGELS